MRQTLFLLFCFIIGNIGYSQVNSETTSKSEEEVLQTLFKDSKRQKEGIFHTLSYLTTGNSFADLGNYISIGTTSETLKASMFFLPTDRILLNFSASTGATEGIAAIFNNGEFNKNLSLSFNGYLMLGKPEANPGESIKDAYLKERKAIIDAYYKKLIDLAKLITPKADPTQKYKALDKNLDVLNDFLAKYENMSEEVYRNTVGENQKLFVTQVRELRDKLTLDRFNDLNHLKDELMKLYEQETNAVIKDSNKSLVEYFSDQTISKNSLDIQPEITKQIDDIDKFLNQYNRMTGLELSKISTADQEFIENMRSLKKELELREKRTKETIIEELKTDYVEERNTKLKELEKKYDPMFKPEVLNVNFIGFGLELTNKYFKQFSGSLALSDQLISRNYNSPTIQFNYNHLSNSRKGKLTTMKLLTTGVRGSFTDNQSNLTKVEIVDTEIIEEESGRTLIKKQDAYVGDYQRDIRQLIIFVDYIGYLSPMNNSWGVRFNPTVTVKENIKPNYSLQVGLILPFKEKATPKVITNLELFYQLKDIFNTEDANTLMSRDVVGIRTAFPFKL